MGSVIETKKVGKRAKKPPGASAASALRELVGLHDHAANCDMVLPPARDVTSALLAGTNLSAQVGAA